MVYYLKIFFLLGLFYSCKSTSDKNNRTDLYVTSYTGYNAKAEAEVCYPKEVLDCANRSEEQSKFLEDCTSFGYEAFECDCEQILCSYNIAKESLSKKLNVSASFTGYDYKGRRRSCSPMEKDVFCTLSVEPADEFAIECVKQGYESIQCACHDHLCSEPLDSF
ncbi:MAG: hypothetical protein HRU09_06460 [Oligoflexales bacterium]|nr:hypothetical protein [Oligoflexales bacterium]